MSMLVVYLVAALCCIVAEGATVSKCDLKQKLTDKLGDRPENSGVNGETLVAEIVCHAEHAAGFTTTAVNDLTIVPEHNTRRKRRSADIIFIDEFPTTVAPTEASSESTVWTLYGLFQLSNHLVCNDSKSETHNICDMGCAELVDDDIEDDLDCLLTLFEHCFEDGMSSPYFTDLKEMLKLIVQDECKAVQPSEYFAECT